MARFEVGPSQRIWAGIAGGFRRGCRSRRVRPSCTGSGRRRAAAGSRRAAGRWRRRPLPWVLRRRRSRPACCRSARLRLRRVVFAHRHEGVVAGAARSRRRCWIGLGAAVIPGLPAKSVTSFGAIARPAAAAPGSAAPTAKLSTSGGSGVSPGSWKSRWYSNSQVRGRYFAANSRSGFGPSPSLSEKQPVSGPTSYSGGSSCRRRTIWVRGFGGFALTAPALAPRPRSRARRRAPANRRNARPRAPPGRRAMPRV